jgi:hypothetical protein
MSEVSFVQGDTGPSIKATLKQRNAAGALVPIDMTALGINAVKFQMRRPDDKRYTVNATADIVDAPNGKVSYDWATNDLDAPGEFQGQWELAYLDGTVQTTDPPNTITVRRQ